MQEVALSNHDVWTLVRSDQKSVVSSFLAGSPVGYDFQIKSIGDGYNRLKSALLIAEKAFVCLSDDHTFDLITFVHEHSNLKKKVVEQAFSKTSSKFPSFNNSREYSNWPEAEVFSFFNNYKTEAPGWALEGILDDPKRFPFEVDWYEDAREGGVFHKFHTFYLGLHLDVPYLGTRDEFETFDQQIKNLVTHGSEPAYTPSNKNYVSSLAELTIPSIPNLNFDEVFQLRNNDFWSQYRSFVLKLYKRNVQPEYIKNQVAEGIKYLLRDIRPNLTRTSVLNIAAASPLGPVNPFSVGAAIKAIDDERNLVKKHGWVWFVLDAEDIILKRPLSPAHVETL